MKGDKKTGKYMVSKKDRASGPHDSYQGKPCQYKMYTGKYVKWDPALKFACPKSFKKKSEANALLKKLRKAGVTGLAVKEIKVRVPWTDSKGRKHFPL